MTAYVVDELHLSERPPFVHRPDEATDIASAGSARAAAAPIRFAGSDSNLPLTRALVTSWQPSDSTDVVVVHGSIGSAGAIRAVRAGAIHVGLVSRPLDEAERRLRLTVTPYARTAVVVAAHESVALAELSTSELVKLFRGTLPLPTNHDPLVLIQREQGHSRQLAMARAISGFPAAHEHAYRKRLGRVVYRDADVQASLRNIPGAIGLFDGGIRGAQPPRMKMLRLDGAEPTVDNLATGTYPAFQDLAFVTVGPPSGAIAEFLDFVFSDAGRRQIRLAGYLPLPRSSP